MKSQTTKPSKIVGTVCHIIYVWGLRYIDDLVFEQWGGVSRYALQDTNWNVVAVVNFGTSDSNLKTA